MIDFVSLFYAMVLGFGIFGLDAVWNAGTVKTDFQVSEKVASAGIKADFATTLFSRELQEVFSTASLVRSPEIRSSHDKSFVTILAESVGLKNATIAFQDLFGQHPVQILATLTTEGTNPRLEVVGETSARGTFYMSLDGQAGETTTALIRRGAIETAIRLDPYHTALYLLDPPSGEPDVAGAKRVLETAVAAQGNLPVTAIRSRFENLRGIVALLEGDKDRAARMFELAIAADPAIAAGHLNLAFTRIEQDRYADAGMIARHVLETRGSKMRPAMLASAHTIAGMAEWGQKRHQAAAEHFRAAVAAEPTVTDAYIYWGRMTAELGNVEEGLKLRRRGEANQALFENYAEVATLYFWMTETDNAPLTRRPRANGGIAMTPEG